MTTYSFDFPNENDWIKDELSTGTTIIAAKYECGIVIGADSRTATGGYVANRVTDKITKLTDHIYVCRSGSAAETQAISDTIAYHLDFFRSELQREPSVVNAAQLFRELGYNFRDQFQVGMIVAGWDPYDGPQIYVVPMGGMCIRQKICIGGSGSAYIYGFVDANYKENMSKEECVEFVQDAITLAIHRDGSSGGVVRLGVLDGEKHIEKFYVSTNNLKEFANE